MVTLIKIKGFVDSLVKFLRFGKGDVQTAPQAAQAGIESKPFADDNGVHSTTSVQNESVILGYIYSFDNVNPGEIRIFARNTDGNEVFSMYFKNDGSVEFGGDADYLVKFAPLDAGLQTQNTAINAELAKIQAAITGLGGTYTRNQINVDIDNSKVNNIKV